jgi:hypothetical protein
LETNILTLVEQSQDARDFNGSGPISEVTKDKERTENSILTLFALSLVARYFNGGGPINEASKDSVANYMKVRGVPRYREISSIEMLHGISVEQNRRIRLENHPEKIRVLFNKIKKSR